jgi:hypothetical protein
MTASAVLEVIAARFMSKLLDGRAKSAAEAKATPLPVIIPRNEPDLRVKSRR